jgi:hypothetical protein
VLAEQAAVLALGFPAVHHFNAAVTNAAPGQMISDFRIRQLRAYRGAVQAPAVTIGVRAQFVWPGRNVIYVPASEPRFLIYAWRTVPLATLTGAGVFHKHLIFRPGGSRAQMPAAFCCASKPANSGSLRVRAAQFE